LQVGYAAHLAGAIAGLLVGITVVRTKKVKWASVVLLAALVLAAIIWNAAFPSYFPPSN